MVSDEMGLDVEVVCSFLTLTEIDTTLLEKYLGDLYEARLHDATLSLHIHA